MRTKKFWNVLTVLVVMFIGAFAFTSCGDDDENDGKGNNDVNQLIGSWVREDTSVTNPTPGDGLFSVLTFKSDGTYIQTWVDCLNGKVTSESNYAKWKAEDSRISITWEGGKTVTGAYSINNGELTMFPPEGTAGKPETYINVNKKTFPDYVKETLNKE